MSEEELISRTTFPATRASLSKQLLDGGLKPGIPVLVHTSM